MPASTAPSSTSGRHDRSDSRQSRAEAVHDFAGKLRQPELWGRVAAYVRWQREARAARRAGAAAPPMPAMAPLSINLDLTTACNYACDHCIDWEILNSPVRHEDQELRDALALMHARGLRSVILIGGGEPTLYPGFAAVVAFLKQLGIQVAVVSNGSRNDRILAAAPHLGPGDWVRLSLDSGSNATFRRMHNPASKTIDLDEICAWIPRIKAVNPRFPIGYSFIITWKGAHRDDAKVVENIDEMVAAARRAREHGFDYISFKPFLERSQEGSEIMHPDGTEDPLQRVLRRIQAALAEARTLERPGFRVMESTNLRVLMQGSWRDYTRQPTTCHMQALRQVVTPLGVFHCPAYRGVERARLGAKDAYKDQAHAEQTLASTARMLESFDAGHECREVTCLYHGTNWWLERLIEDSGELEGLAQARGEPDYFL